FAYIALWTFAAGGIIDRYARDRTTGPHGFFSAAGVYFGRFLRLGIIQLAVYGLLFQVVHPYLFGSLYARLTRDLTVERDAFFVRVAFYLVFGALIAVCNLVFDYAKIRAVVEDRRSMLGAIGASIRFVRRNGAAIGLYLLNVGVFAVSVAVYGVVAPGAGSSGLTMWAAFALGQLYVVARLWVKLLFWASEAALFQARLAHAGYVALPQPTWPDSPTADAI